MNILIIEDDNDLIELIAYNLQKNNFCVTKSYNANDGLILTEDINFNLILLDLMLPGLKGMEFLKIIRSKENTKNIPVIIISAKNSEQDIVTALEAGADDYLTKPFTIKMMITKINTILRRGNINFEKTIYEYGNIKLYTENYRTFINEQEIKLTNKEFELLKLFITNPNKIFTRNILLNTLWGYDSDSMTRTVDAHISSLRKKLGKNCNIIKSISKIGYGIEE